MIHLERASRWYGEVIGLNDVTCTIGPGVTALLGMNGAGKTTMMRMITGQIRETTGTIDVFGMEPFANPEVFKRVGYCPEIDNLHESRSGRQFVNMLARMAGYGADEARQRTQHVLEIVGMADRCDKPILSYSKGMRQRIKLAQAIVHDPDAILLDEPLNGLDPVARREFMNMLSGLADAGKTILVSSHILFEVEQMTRSILLLHRGRLLATGDLRVIRDFIDQHPHRIRIDSSQARELAARLVALPYVLSVEVDAEGLEVQTNQPGDFYDQLPRLVLEEGLSVEGFDSPDNNLESIFKYLVTT